MPTIYVNDNFGRWRSDFNATLENSLGDASPGRDVARALAPDDDDYFVLKPKRSAFYGTSLDLLLAYLGAETVVVVGFTTDMCVYSTAHDAFLRDLRVVIASDCCASLTMSAHRRSLVALQQQMRIEVATSTRIQFAALRRRKTRERVRPNT